MRLSLYSEHRSVHVLPNLTKARVVSITRRLVGSKGIQSWYVRFFRKIISVVDRGSIIRNFLEPHFVGKPK